MFTTISDGRRKGFDWWARSGAWRLHESHPWIAAEAHPEFLEGRKEREGTNACITSHSTLHIN